MSKKKLVKNEERSFQRQAREMVLNTMMMRQEWIRRVLSDERRDIDQECRYPDDISPDDYRGMFDRNGVAKRVVNIEPKESFAVIPEVYDSEESEETDFEKVWKNLYEKKHVFSYLKRVDMLSGIGRYGVLLIGVDDGKSLDEPIEGLEDAWEELIQKGEYPENVKEHKLLFLRALDESMASIVKWETDETSPRFGQPTMYSITVVESETPSVWGMNRKTKKKLLRNKKKKKRLAKNKAVTTTSAKVHWTRILHVADNKLTSETFGTPRMEDVWNDLLDLKKINGSSAEGYWQAGFPGLSFESQPGLENAAFDLDAVKEQARMYFESLQRYIGTTGMNVKSLTPNIQDPTPHWDTKIKNIALAKGIPYRVFLGTEEAKLAGGEDKDSWRVRIVDRRMNYLTPEVIRPLCDRFILLGVLPVPEDGKYTVEWPNPFEPTEDTVATRLQKITMAIKDYIMGNGDQLISPKDYLTQFMNLKPDVVTMIMKNVEKEMKKEQATTEPVPMPAATKVRSSQTRLPGGNGRPRQELYPMNRKGKKHGKRSKS